MALMNPNIATNYEAIGPLAGVMADQKYNDWQTQQGLETQRNMIENQAAQHTLDQSVLDDPVKAAQRQANITTADITTRTGEAAYQAKLADEISKKSTAELKTADNKAEWMATATPWLNADSPAGFDSSPAANARWQQFKDEAKQVGINFKTDAWSPEAQKEVQVKAQGSAEYRKYRQANQMQDKKLASEERIAEGRNATALAVGAMGADKATNMALLNASPAKRAEMLVGLKPIINGADLTSVIQAKVTEDQAGDNAKQLYQSTWAKWENTTDAARLKQGAELNIPLKPNGSAPSPEEIALATQQQMLRSNATDHVLRMFADKDYMDEKGRVTKLGSVSGKATEKDAATQSKGVNPVQRQATPPEQKIANTMPSEIGTLFPRGGIRFETDPSNPAMWKITRKSDGAVSSIPKAGAMRAPQQQAPQASQEPTLPAMGN